VYPTLDIHHLRKALLHQEMDHLGAACAVMAQTGNGPITIKL
jgi:hypothetical protein